MQKDQVPSGLQDHLFLQEALTGSLFCLEAVLEDNANIQWKGEVIEYLIHPDAVLSNWPDPQYSQEVLPGCLCYGGQVSQGSSISE